MGSYSYKNMSSLLKTANNDSQTFPHDICPEDDSECIQIYFFLAVCLFTVILLGIGFYWYKKYGCPCPKPNTYQTMDEGQPRVAYHRKNKVQPESVTTRVDDAAQSYEVQVYHPQGAGMAFVDELMKNLNIDDNEYSIITSVEELRSDHPVLAICMNSSRLGTDASWVVKGISEYKSSVLLIFHHKDEHALPDQPSSRLLVDSEFDHLCGIYDVACLTGKGVYPCSMNTKSEKEIRSYIEHHNKELHNLNQCAERNEVDRY